MRRIAAFAAAALAAGANAWASALPRPDPIRDADVPLSGRPAYVEDLTIGGPVSDYGSHMGVKASARHDAEAARGDPLHLDARTLLSHAQYAAATDDGRQMDQAFLSFTDGEGRERFAPAAAREIAFFPWGWRERAEDGGLRALGVVRTLAEDAFLLGAVVENAGPSPATLTPRLRLQNELDPTIESNFPSDPLEDAASARLAEGLLLVDYSAPRILGLFGRSRFQRAFALEPEVRALASAGGPNRYRHAAALAPFVLAPGERRGVYAVQGFGRTEAEAASRARAALARMRAFSEDPALAVLRAAEDADAEWAAFLGGLRPPHTDRASDRTLYDLAATALRMNVYAPRNRMTERCSVPSKAHFNFFFVWDTPLQALGHVEFDLALAKENLGTAFAFDRTSAAAPLPMLMDDSLRISPTNLGTNLSQPPVHGWVQDRLLDQGAAADSEFLRRALEFGERYVDWWRADRDRDGSDLFSWLYGLESGWDDQPALGCPIAATNFCFLPPATRTEALDLSSWLYAYERNLARIAALLGEEGAASLHAERAAAVAGAIERDLWNERVGAYQHRERGGPFSERGLSPATAFPLFLGIARDEGRARRVVEEHLLNPDAFWFTEADGRLPVPSVAYGDPAYDHAQDGYYWQGQMWLVPNWIVATALFRYGYEAEARALVDRTLAGMAAASDAGIFEAYDALGAGVGWGSGGPGDPAAFQFGWSSALLMHLALGRHERERYVMPGERAARGFMARAETLDGSRVLYEVAGAATMDVPRAELTAEAPLASARRIAVRLSDPYGNLAARSVKLRVRPAAGSGVAAALPNGARVPVPAEFEDGAVAFTASVAAPGEPPILYEVGDVSAPDSSGDGGCGCATAPGDPPGAGPLRAALVLGAVLAARAGLRFVTRRRGLA